MTNLPRSSKYVVSAQAPLEATERDDVIARVNAAFTEGTLSEGEYQDALDRTFAARTLGELVPVVEKLPARASYAAPANIESAPLAPGELSAARQPNARFVWGVVIAGGVALLLIALLLGFMFV